LSVFGSGVLNVEGSVFGNNGSFSQAGTGTVILNGSNSFPGGYQLSSGVLGIGHDMALGSGSLTVQEGGVLRAINGSRTIGNQIVVRGDFIIDGDQEINFAGNFQFFSSPNTLVVENTALTSFSGNVHGNLIKDGSGVVEFPGVNLGNIQMVVREGTLNLNNANEIYSSSISQVYEVRAGAILGGSGGSNRSTILVDGKLSPGVGVESLRAQTLDLRPNSVYIWEAIDSSTVGADLMRLDGSLTINGSILDLSLADLANGSWRLGDKLTMLSYNGPAINSGFVGFIDDQAYSFGAKLWTINYNDVAAGTNFQVEATGTRFVTFTVTGIPEPSCFPVLAIGILTITIRRRNDTLRH
jgi:autotransporter-associated beta strand protein